MKGFVIPAIFKAIDQFTAPMKSMQGQLGTFANKMNQTSRQAFKVASVAAIGATAVLAPIGLAANSAIKFEDQLADVGKTTGLQGKELDDLGKHILKMSETTRTAIPDILKITEIGGQLGVAKGELLAFTDASNKFAVALASDYSGGVEGAISSVGKIKSLFKETRQASIDDVITRAGSVINELGAVGAGTSENINDFVLRIGALPDAIKPSMTATAALGTFFEEVGIDSQIAAGGLSNFFLVAGKDIAGFAKQMKMPVAAAKKLLATDSAAFATQFATSLQGLKPDQLATKLNDLKIGSQETIKVLGALGSNTQRVGELTNIASQAYVNGTSLQDEYNRKNSTTAALLEQAKNNMQSLAITVGTTLLPILNDMLQKVMPIVRSFMDWVREHQTLVKWIMIVGGVIGTALLVLSGFATVVGIITKAIWAWQVAQWAINAAISANPIMAIVLAIAALIGVIVLVIKKWDSWGAAVAAFMGPLGWVISLIQSFRKNWGLVSKAFKTDGILGAIKAIGKILLDVILYPLQQILEIASYIPGAVGDWAAEGANQIKKFRQAMGTEAIPENEMTREQLQEKWNDEERPMPARVYPELSLATAQSQAAGNDLMNKLNFMKPQTVEMKITTDKGTTAEVTKKSEAIKPTVTESLGGGLR